MTIEHNLYEYKLLHEQHSNLHHELEKYILLQKNMLWSLETIEHLFGETTHAMQGKLYEMIASLQEAQASNAYITNELQERIIGIYELLKFSKNTLH